MRLQDWDQADDYKPLERGEAFPQFYEDGDKVRWHHEMMWNYRFWQSGVFAMEVQHNTFDPMWLMGSEL